MAGFRVLADFRDFVASVSKDLLVSVHPGAPPTASVGFIDHPPAMELAGRCRRAGLRVSVTVIHKVGELDLQSMAPRYEYREYRVVFRQPGGAPVDRAP